MFFMILQINILGNAKGEPAEIEWQINARQVTVSGGPFQWFKRYKMCDSRIYMGKTSYVYDKCLKDYPGTNKQYDGKLCNPECEFWEQTMETSLAADVGFYYHFESDPKTGQPYGCPGFKANVDDWDNGVGFSK